MIALIDADSLIYSAEYNRGPDEAVQYINDKLDEILERTECDNAALFLTMGKTFRNEVKSYKSSRPKGRKSPCFYYVREYLISVKNANWQDNVEADDLVIYWHYKDKENTRVVSPDKDVKNMTSFSYDYRKNEIFENPDTELLFWEQMLTGDSADGVKGIPGIGPAKTEKLLENVTDYGILVFSEYLKHFGSYEGVQQFYDAYKQLYILNEDKHFQRHGLSLPTSYKMMIGESEF